ncbi:acetyl-CoA carboxylase biotin carboxylase subunit [Bacillus sp. FJAT-42376]|uniref:acetyl-CoA carboxylase biotin carboxylase subunit n=1 Tax=Bacillus sp. FJAT-42376 TaxID=2014076 RepID=UPI000F4DEF3D|nr:acetyl-CoA carboxylase biotin carboxylase subunit [Bacillus sp. FJAT-42376]AZB42827.1 acetyl-CoA carboxylase biotin carboxylase subunit [Bacillus sp. FJAT-42376]
MKKVLIANRGEIASRIMETCRQMDIETIAIYSDADKDLPYVKEADYSFRIGEPPVAKSYLLADSILELAVREGADAVHPGYGFLSENSEFVRKTEEQGLIFIGPSSSVIEKMGDKVVARQTMIDAGIPVVPGSDSGLETFDQAAGKAAEIGYPVMLKASGGGGGIGMQLCMNEAELEKVFASTKTRAKAYFGNDEVFLEKYISESRHIEVQIFGDGHGNIVHLYERECSVQRRNQKVIEEAPSPSISEETRKKICEAAVLAARHVGYRNAGTVEFIMDEKEEFYFLEMNTRLQVEHRVTEMITGLDLVKWQILAARGEALPLKQGEIRKIGHALEFRIYAEDPEKFIPSPGSLNVFTYPEPPGFVLDRTYEEGNQITPFYDPLIAKAVVYGENRELALSKSAEVFKEMQIGGVKSNLPLFEKVLKDGEFKTGHYTTSYLKQSKIVG